MINNQWHKKEKPLLGLLGSGGGMAQSGGAGAGRAGVGAAGGSGIAALAQTLAAQGQL